MTLISKRGNDALCTQHSNVVFGRTWEAEERSGKIVATVANYYCT